jgi:hypothetical protein
VATRPGEDDQLRGTLGAILANLDAVPRGLTIYVPGEQELGHATAVILADEDVDGPPPGARYLLEISLAKEVLEVWSSWRNGRSPEPSEACAAVIHYAIHDAYLPT